MEANETIFLIPDEDGYSWCDEPAPGIGMDEKDSISYIRTDRFDRIEAINAELVEALTMANSVLSKSFTQNDVDMLRNANNKALSKSMPNDKDSGGE